MRAARFWVEVVRDVGTVVALVLAYQVGYWHRGSQNMDAFEASASTLTESATRLTVAADMTTVTLKGLFGQQNIPRDSVTASTEP